MDKFQDMDGYAETLAARVAVCHSSNRIWWTTGVDLILRILFQLYSRHSDFIIRMQNEKENLLSSCPASCGLYEDVAPAWLWRPSPRWVQSCSNNLRHIQFLFFLFLQPFTPNFSMMCLPSGYDWTPALININHLNLGGFLSEHSVCFLILRTRGVASSSISVRFSGMDGDAAFTEGAFFFLPCELMVGSLCLLLITVVMKNQICATCEEERTKMVCKMRPWNNVLLFSSLFLCISRIPPLHVAADDPFLHSFAPVHTHSSA